MPDSPEFRSKWANRWFDVRRLTFTIIVVLRSVLTAWRERGPDRHPGGWPISLRVLFERLGLTYLKMGQYLALRLDLLPPEVRRDLEQLFENVQPVEFERIRKLIEDEFGEPLEESFPKFVQNPIAAASIAQVHLATTASGIRVAVKIQRPDIERTFDSDVRLMRRFARIGDIFALAGTISLSDAVEQF